jgi:hypothetical protein
MSHSACGVSFAGTKVSSTRMPIPRLVAVSLSDVARPSRINLEGVFERGSYRSPQVSRVADNRRGELRASAYGDTETDHRSPAPRLSTEREQSGVVFIC